MTLQIPTYVDEDGFFHVYTDASVTSNYEYHSVGLAWVKVETDIAKPTTESDKLEFPITEKSHGKASYTGEFQAAINALKSFPKNSTIRLMTDHDAVLKHLNGQKKSRLIDSLAAELLDAASRHKAVEAISAYDRAKKEPNDFKRFFMQIAHTKAAKMVNSSKKIRNILIVPAGKYNIE